MSANITTFTCEFCGLAGDLPTGRGTRIKKYCSATCKAKARTAAANSKSKVAIACRSCGKTRYLTHPKAAGETCRQCAAANGSTAAAVANTRPPIERFMDFVRKDASGCWLWNGSRQANGYGVFGVHGRTLRAHRVSYEMHVGLIPEGLQIDHLCRVRECVNPAHLEPVTPQENSRRAMRPACVNGHEFTSENTYMHGGKRYCRECRRKRNRMRYADAAA